MTDWPKTLSEWSKVCEAATAGPWAYDLDCFEPGVIEASVFDVGLKMLFSDDTGYRYETEFDDAGWKNARESQAFKNAAFIALARTALPEAIERIRELEAAIEAHNINAPLECRLIYV